MAGLILLAGCGSDTTAIELASIGRDVESGDAMTEDGDVVDGLLPCAEVAMLTPDGDGTPAGPISLDQELLALLADYGSENPDTYAGLWLDARYAGAPVVAFSDEPGPHRDAILNRLSTGGGMPFGLVRADHSLRELEAAASELSRSSSAVQSATVDQGLNRVMVALLDPTEADLEGLDRLAPDGLVCTDIIISPPRPDGPLDVLPRDGRPDLLSCGDEPFPQSALTEPVPMTESDHPAAAAVARFTGDAGSEPGAERGSGGAPGDWIVLDTTGDRALFGKYADRLEATVSVVGNGSGWEVSGWSFGCELRVGLPHGLGAVEVFLDPSAPARPDGTTVTVLVSELACAGGEAMGDRLLGPQVVEDGDRILLAFAAVAPPIEHQECPGNPRTAVVVDLDQSLGDRTVMDGMRLPPRPLTNP